jgi:hypothetical protein
MKNQWKNKIMFNFIISVCFLLQLGILSESFKISTKYRRETTNLPLFAYSGRNVRKESENDNKVWQRPKNTFRSVGKRESEPQGSSGDDKIIDGNSLVRLDDEERLQKIIARSGVASRREAEKMVFDSEVEIQTANF